MEYPGFKRFYWLIAVSTLIVFAGGYVVGQAGSDILFDPSSSPVASFPGNVSLEGNWLVQARGLDVNGPINLNNNDIVNVSGINGEDVGDTVGGGGGMNNVYTASADLNMGPNSVIFLNGDDLELTFPSASEGDEMYIRDDYPGGNHIHDIVGLGSLEGTGTLNQTFLRISNGNVIRLIHNGTDWRVLAFNAGEIYTVDKQWYFWGRKVTGTPDWTQEVPRDHPEGGHSFTDGDTRLQLRISCAFHNVDPWERGCDEAAWTLGPINWSQYDNVTIDWGSYGCNLSCSNGANAIYIGTETGDHTTGVTKQLAYDGNPIGSGFGTRTYDISDVDTNEWLRFHAWGTPGYYYGGHGLQIREVSVNGTVIWNAPI